MIIKKRTRDFLARFSGEARYEKAAQFGYSKADVIAAFSEIQQEPVQQEPAVFHNSYGDSEIDSMETLLAAANRHRRGMGLQPKQGTPEVVENGYAEINSMEALISQAARIRAAM